MADKKNESPEDLASDLDLEDLGVQTSEVTIDIDPRSLPIIILGIVICGLSYMLLTNIVSTVTALVVALLFSLALDPVIRKVQYLSFGKFITVKLDKNGNPVERIPRYGAVAIVLGTALISISTFAYFLAPTVVDQAKNFTKDIPETVRELGDLPIVGDQLGSEKTQENIKKALEEIPSRLSSKDSPIGGIVKGVVNGAYLGFLFVLMFIALLLDGPRLIRNIRRLIPAEKRQAADRIGRVVHKVIGRYMAGSILVAVLAGFVIGTSGLILGVPLAPLLALWITFTNLIPQIGGFLGGFPFVVLGFTVSPIVGVICLVIFIVYQQIENHIIQPIVIGKTVKISPPVTMVAALIGVAAGGILGAMLAVPCVGGAKALAAEFDFPKGARAKSIENEKITEEAITHVHAKLEE